MKYPVPFQLDYASPGRRGSPLRPSVRSMLTGVVLQALLASTNVKVTPGGPFVSITGEVFPVAICFVVLTLGVRSLITGTPLRRIAMAGIMTVSAVIASIAIVSVVDHWRAPRSRGAILGF